jgi:hypothetical protein
MRPRDGAVYVIIAYTVLAIVLCSPGSYHSLPALLSLSLLLAALPKRLRKGLGAPLFLAGLVYAYTVAGSRGLFFLPSFVFAPLLFEPRTLMPGASRLPSALVLAAHSSTWRPSLLLVSWLPVCL